MAHKRFVTIQILPDDSSEAWTLKLRYRFFEFLFYAIIIALFAMGFAAVKITQIQGKVLLANHLASRNKQLLEEQKKVTLLEKELAAVSEKEKTIREILQAFMVKPSTDSARKAQIPAWTGNFSRYLESVQAVQQKIESGNAEWTREKQPDIWPVKGIVSQKFSLSGPEGRHDGIDILAEENALVVSSGRGVVTEAGWDKDLGRFVKISHDLQLQSVYGHLSRALVQPGHQVRKGEAVGLVGSTGRSLGPHLHFEIIFKGNAVDPMPYFQ